MKDCSGENVCVCDAMAREEETFSMELGSVCVCVTFAEDALRRSKGGTVMGALSF